MRCLHRSPLLLLGLFFSVAAAGAAEPLNTLSDKEKAAFAGKAKEKSMAQVAGELLDAFNPDTLDALR